MLNFLLFSMFERANVSIQKNGKNYLFYLLIIVPVLELRNFFVFWRFFPSRLKNY
jgi:hypothetical protein